tara:strand:- start:3280 stop:3690 length:411 start_codon:yes stop_codon:yes gene_type:complete
MYNPIDLWYDADMSNRGVKMQHDGCDSIIYMGIKIERKGNDVRLINTKKGGNFYKEITDEQYDMFFENGFLLGVYNVVKVNTERSLNVVTETINEELTGTRNEKKYEYLKTKRMNLMNKLTDIIKLIQNENNKHKR